MRNRVTQISGAVLALVLLLAGLATMTASAAYPSGGTGATGSSGASGANGVSGPFVSTAVRSDVSPPLRSIAPIAPQTGTAGEFPLHPLDSVRERLQLAFPDGGGLAIEDRNDECVATVRFPCAR